MSDALSSAAMERVLLGFRYEGGKPGEQFEVSAHILKHCLVMRIAGTALDRIPIDYEQGLNDIFRYRRAHRAVIDLTACDFVSSLTMSLLIRFAQRAREMGGEVVLVAPTSRVRSILRTFGVERTFAVVDDLDQAIARLETVSQAAPARS